MLLTIIVPVYNVKAYLSKCAGSLLDQDIELSDYEIILVDDGSTDGSGVLCDELAAVNGNIRVIHKENGGLSSARNAGIQAAAGEYVQFVDSDDYLCPCVLKGLLEQMMAQKLDILRYNYQNVNERGEVFEPNKEYRPFVDFSTDVSDGLTFLTEKLGYACYACQFIVKTEILRSGNGLFTEGIWFEDVDWTPRVLLQADRVASTSQVVYNYLFREGSISRSPSVEKKRKKISDQFFLIDSLNKLSANVTDTRWFRGMASQIALSIIQSVSQSFFEERKDHIGALRDRHVFPLSSFHATKSARRKIRIANISPMLFCRLINLRQG